VIDARVVSAKRAHTNDCHPNWTFVSQPMIFSDVSQSGKGYHESVRRNTLWDAPLAFCL
jgi:hypothetical protein